MPEDVDTTDEGVTESWEAQRAGIWGVQSLLPVGLHTEGLFRRSASAQTVRQVQRLYDQGDAAGPSLLPESRLPPPVLRCNSRPYVTPETGLGGAAAQEP